MVTPRGTYVVSGEQEMTWTARGGHERASETHFALRVDRRAAEVVEIA